MTRYDVETLVKHYSDREYVYYMIQTNAIVVANFKFTKKFWDRKKNYNVKFLGRL